MNEASLFRKAKQMVTGHFYFISDKYFMDFPDPFLMQNKETVNGQPHRRPCFYAFLDSDTGLYWLIPFSSKVSKFRKIYNRKTAGNRTCDTIIFGSVLGHEKAFLIQNMCPVSMEYIDSEYMDVNMIPVRIAGNFERELISKAKKVIALQRKGVKLIFPDVLSIEQKLLAK